LAILIFCGLTIGEPASADYGAGLATDEFLNRLFAEYEAGKLGYELSLTREPYEKLGLGSVSRRLSDRESDWCIYPVGYTDAPDRPNRRIYTGNFIETITDRQSGKLLAARVVAYVDSRRSLEKKFLEEKIRAYESLSNAVFKILLDETDAGKAWINMENAVKKFMDDPQKALRFTGEDRHYSKFNNLDVFSGVNLHEERGSCIPGKCLETTIRVDLRGVSKPEIFQYLDPHPGTL
jgi:hypothetical protein